MYVYIYMCENKLQCIICSDIHMSHNDNSRNVSHTFLIDHNLSGPGRSHAQAAKQHLLLISRPPARWATGFSGDLQHNYLLLYIMFCFCNVCTIVLEINILLLHTTICFTGLLLVPLITKVMMTSSNGNIFHVTGQLFGEFTGDQWIPRTKAIDAEIWCFLWVAPE